MPDASLSKRTGMIVLITLFMAGGALAQEVAQPLSGHVLYGKMIIENDDADVAGDDYKLTIFGVGVQKPFNPGVFKVGLETGALFSLDSDLRRFSAASGSGGGTVDLSVDISSFLMDFFFGGYVAFEPAGWLRMYVGAGPLLIWGTREIETTETTGQLEVSEASESGLGAGGYIRAGIDILFSDYLGLTAGARITETTLSFDDAAGSIDIEGVQYYGGLAFRF